MTDETEVVEEVQEEQPQTQVPTDEVVKTVPYPRFQAVIKQVRDLEAELDNQRKQYDTVLQKQVTNMQQGLSEPVLALLDKLPVQDKLDWLLENKDKVVDKPASGIPQTPNGKDGSSLTEEQRRKMAARTF
jgi:hypothetical protein